MGDLDRRTKERLAASPAFLSGSHRSATLGTAAGKKTVVIAHPVSPEVGVPVTALTSHCRRPAGPFARSSGSNLPV